MLFLTRNFELVKNREKTFLTAAISATATTLTVKAVDSNAWANNDWVIVGEIGTKNAEILQINGSVSDGTSLTIDNAGSGGARYAHSVDEPVYRIDYNQYDVYRNTTDSTSGLTTLVSGREIQVDDLFSRYEDGSNSTGYGFIRFYNSQTGGYSDYSDGIPYTGYTPRSLGRMIRKVRKLLGEISFKYVQDEDITDEINEGQRDIAHERLWPFYEDIFSTSRIANTREYSIGSGVVIGKPHSITCESEPLAKVDNARYEQFFWDTVRTGEPTHVNVWNNKIRLYPVPSDAASTTTLNGAISSATATTITLTDTSALSPSGRIIVDSEVISYDNKSTTQILGCQRGLEGTTATTHLTGSTVTERDIIYTANVEPTELVDIQDETDVPDPAALEYYAAMNLAIGKLSDQVLHDRMKLKHAEAVQSLRDKFGIKITSQGYRIKDKNDIVRDTSMYRNPNDYPTSVGV